MAEAKTESAVKAKKTSAASKTEGVKAAPKKAPAAKVAAPKAVAAAKKPASAKAKKSVTPEQRYMMICEAAYFKAQSRGFAPENEIQDWLDAEAEINQMLGK